LASQIKDFLDFIHISGQLFGPLVFGMKDLDFWFFE
jgi:hypothetical protein